MLSQLKNLFLDEASRWVLWLPVFLGLGIALFFSYGQNVSEKSAFAAVSMAVSLFALNRKRPIARYVAIITLTIAIGFAAAKFRTEFVKAPIIPVINSPITLSGNIAEISYSTGFPVLILENLRIDNLDKRYIPKKIRLNVRTKIRDEIRPGDRVITDAKLMPPARPVIKGGYDFARDAYYQQIGATGFAIKPIVKLKQGGVDSWLENMRYEISLRIRGALSGDVGAISEALITGQRAHISKDTYNNMRRAGLAHLLAVSGMNLALVGGIIFFSVRFLLNLNYKLGEKYSTKKIAAFIAIFINFLYLLISGSTISAQRAFLMVTLIMLGVVLDRAVTPMRSVAFAAFVILLIEPESLLSAGFQMSFAAVLALISIYELVVKRVTKLDPNYVNDDKEKWYKKLHNKLWLYPLTVILTSAVAGLATAPFSAYHFNQVSNYHGVFANLAASPIVSFFIMPFAVIGMLLMPFGLEQVGLVPMSYGVKVILWVAEHVALRQDSSLMVKQMPNWGFYSIILGGLWLLLWNEKWRYAGLVGVVAGLLSYQFIRLPDIIISENGKLFAINYDRKLYFSNTRQSFATKEWLAVFGQEEPLELDYADSYKLNGHVFNPYDRCIDSQCITLQDLQNKGTHSIYFDNQEVIIETVIY